MKNKKIKNVFVYFFALITSLTVFLLVSMAYLNLQNTQKNASAKKQNEPYYTGPKSSGILFEFEGGKGFFVYLDFKSSKTYFALTENETGLRIHDKPVNFTVKTDYTLLSGIIDRVGGVELTDQGETGRYTGEQIVEIISRSPSDNELRYKIAESVFSSISKNGFSNEDFVYIIENSGTDMLFPDCIDWQDYIKDTVSLVEVIS